MFNKRLILYMLLAAISGSGLYFVFLKWPAGRLLSEAPRAARIFTEQPGPIRTRVHLYFARRDNSFLSAEKRDIYHQGDSTSLAVKIVEALIDGPGDELMRTVPADAALRALYLGGEKTAYLDVTEALRENHPGGIQSELMTVYSIVNSLVLNVSAIESVKILIDGHEAMTLSGHVDLRFPFKANMLMVR